MTKGEMMVCQAPPTHNRKSDINFKQVKLEGEVHFEGQKVGFATPLYATIPKLGNGGQMSKKEFAEKYDFNCEGLSPKRMKVPRDITLEEINKFFEPIVNKNGYS